MWDNKFIFVAGSDMHFRDTFTDTTQNKRNIQSFPFFNESISLYNFPEKKETSYFEPYSNILINIFEKNIKKAYKIGHSLGEKN